MENKIGPIEKLARGLVNDFFSVQVLSRIDVTNKSISEHLETKNRRKVSDLVEQMGFSYSAELNNFAPVDDKEQKTPEERVDYLLDNLTGRQLESLYFWYKDLETTVAPLKRTRNRKKFANGYNTNAKKVKEQQTEKNEKMLEKMLGQFNSAGISPKNDSKAHKGTGKAFGGKDTSSDLKGAKRKIRAIKKGNKVKRLDDKGRITKEYLETLSKENLLNRLDNLNRLISSDPKPDEKWEFERKMINGILERRD